MAIFLYKAVNAQGKIVKGRLDASHSADLEQRIGSMGLDLINVKEVRPALLAFTRRKVSRQDLIGFCFHMEQMTQVGVPIVDALLDFRDSTENAHFKETSSSMIDSIKGGKTFSGAMAEFPRVFDEVLVSLINVGEQSGKLNAVLVNITATLKWQDELAAQMKKVVMYPIFVGAVVTGVIFFLMIYLVPQMVGFIENMGHTLPLHTQALIALSHFFSHYWYLIISVPTLLLFGLSYLTKVKPNVRYQVDAFKLNLWLIGPILRKIILSRFASYFALLYSSGVTVLQSLQICEDIAGNKVIATALHRAHQEIANGKNMSESFKNSALFPPLVLRMIKIGENTGGLDTALLNVSYFYNRDVKDGIEKLQRMIEPMMTVVLGLILLWVMLSVLGPIYDIISKIKT